MLLLAISTCCFGQSWKSIQQNGTSDTNPKPTNGLKQSTLNIGPDGRAQYQVCVSTVAGGTTTPAPNVLIHITGGTVIGSGWHPHEEATPFLSDQRPGVIPVGLPVASPTSTTWAWDNGGIELRTDSTGCVYPSFDFPGFSGWYWFAVRSDPYIFGSDYEPGLIGGDNIYVKYVPPAGEEMVQYVDPNDQFAMSPYDSQDSDHFPGWLYLRSDIDGAVQTAAARYASQTGNDKVFVWRGSLQDGGVADNYYPILLPGSSTAFPGFAPSSSLFQTVPWEEHFYGTEVDIANPATGPLDINAQLLSVADRQTLFQVLVLDFEASVCVVGLNEPGVVSASGDFPDRVTAQAYWVTQASIHLICAPSPLPRSTKLHPTH